MYFGSQKENIEWGKLGFNYYKTAYNVRFHYADGKWGAMEATDDETRTAILGEIQDATYEYGPFAMIAQAPAHIGFNTRLTGVAVSDPYTLDVTMINIAE